jgi:hypothetical protein
MGGTLPHTQNKKEESCLQSIVTVRCTNVAPSGGQRSVRDKRVGWIDQLSLCCNIFCCARSSYNETYLFMIVTEHPSEAMCEPFSCHIGGSDLGGESQGVRWVATIVRTVPERMIEKPTKVGVSQRIEKCVGATVGCSLSPNEALEVQVRSGSHVVGMSQGVSQCATDQLLSPPPTFLNILISLCRDFTRHSSQKAVGEGEGGGIINVLTCLGSPHRTIRPTLPGLRP